MMRNLIFIKKQVSKLKAKKLFINITKSCFNISLKGLKDIEGKDNTTLLKEFKEMLKNKPSKDELEKRIKILSVELLQKEYSIDVLNFFEENYANPETSIINGEELVLFVYFYINLLNNEKKIQKLDQRFITVTNMLKEKLIDLDIYSLISLTWSLNLAVTKHNYEIDSIFALDLIKKFNQEIPIDKILEVPNICYSISNFYNKDLSIDEVQEQFYIESYSTIKNLSEIYFKNSSSRNLHQLSFLLISWAKFSIDDKELILKLISELKELEVYLSSDNLEEMLKILYSASILRISNNEFEDVVFRYFDSVLKDLELEKIIDAFVSIISFASNNTELVQLFLQSIEYKLKNSDDNFLDKNTFINLLLALAKYKSKINKGELQPSIIEKIMNLFDKYSEQYKYFIDKNDVCSILVSISLLKLESYRIVDVIIPKINDNLGKFDLNQLIQLTSASGFMKDNKKYNDIWNKIRENCLNVCISPNEQQSRIMKRLFTESELKNKL